MLWAAASVSGIDVGEADLAREAYRVAIATFGGMGMADAMALELGVWDEVLVAAEERLAEMERLYG
jgi:hypothetical protein